MNQYLLNNSILPVIESEKEIVNRLSWDYHINEIENISKAEKCVGWATRIIISGDCNVMLNIYKSLIRPNIEYIFRAVLWHSL